MHDSNDNKTLLPTPFALMWAVMYPSMPMPGKPTGEKCTEPGCECDGHGEVLEMVEFCVASN